MFAFLDHDIEAALQNFRLVDGLAGDVDRIARPGERNDFPHLRLRRLRQTGDIDAERHRIVGH